MPPRRSKRLAPPNAAALENTQIPDGYVQLPHNMGLVKATNTQTEQTTNTKKEQTTNTKKEQTTNTKKDQTTNNKKEQTTNDEAKLARTHRYSLRSRKTSNLNPAQTTQEPPAKRQRTKKSSAALDTSQPIQPSEETKKVPKQGRSPYHVYTTVPWGETPWPELSLPSPDDCETVYAILSAQHANGHLKFERPPKIPPPSLEVAGCGETPLVLDGLIRTILSGATTMANANNAIERVSSFYGTVTKSVLVDGEETTPVKDAIDWNRVRLLGVDEFERQIHTGGLQKGKSKAIIANLDKIHALNAKRCAAFKHEKATGTPANVPGAEKLTQRQKDMEIWMFENQVISLEHIRSLSAEQVMNELVQLDQVAVKTAACVLLFSLQEPCFAVDTHCLRMAHWLGWLPNDTQGKVGPSKAFAHLNLRIPDHLKYGLHQLFIEHGQNCERCRAITNEGSKDWESCVCPVEHLLKRTKRERKERGTKREAGETGKGSGQEDEQTDEQSLDDSGDAEAVFNPALQQQDVAPEKGQGHQKEGGDEKEGKEEEYYTPTKIPGVSKKRPPPVGWPQRQAKKLTNTAASPPQDAAADSSSGGGSNSSADGLSQGIS